MQYICSNCGYTNKDKFIYEDIFSVIKFFFNSLSMIIRSIAFIIIFCMLLCIPVIGWILALGMLFIPINKVRNNNCCPGCNAENCLVSLNTPKGKKLYNEYYGESEKEEK